MAAVTAAGVIVGPAGGEVSARVLPDLAAAVPMKAKLRKQGRGFLRLLLPELNPDPLADNVRDPPELRGFGLEQSQQLLCVQLPVAFPQLEIQPWQLPF